MVKNKKKLLLIKLSSLGDVIFNIPLANALKDAGYEVTWMVSEKGLQVVQNNPCVDHTILAPVVKWKKRGMSFESFKEYLSILKRIRAEKFDVAIDSQMLLKSMYWMIFSGAKRRITSIEAREFAFLGANDIIGRISVPHSPIIYNYLRFAQHLGVNTDNIKITLPERTKEQIEKIDNLLSGLDKAKPLVVIAPATTWPNKHWNKDNWRTVVNNISEKCNLIFTGGKNDNELINYISGGKFLNLAGKTDILELAEIFSRAALVMAPDSGSAHLAWATQKPAVITIFTCTPKDVLAPYGDKNKYIALGGEGLQCQPCFKRHCNLKGDKNICTFSPPAQKVIQTVNSLIFEGEML